MTALPAGLKVRPFRIDTDVPPLLHLLADAEAVDDSGELFSEELLRLYLSLPGHNPQTDRWVIEDTKNDMFVGHAALQLPGQTDERWGVADGTLVAHPQRRRRGLGTALFTKLEERLEKTTNVSKLRFYLSPQLDAATAFARARQFAPNSADTYTEMHATLTGVTAKPVLPAGFALRSYRDVDHLPTLVKAVGQGYAGLYGHHQATEEGLAPRLAEMDRDGQLLLFAPDGSVAGTVGAELAPDLTERNGVLTGRVNSPGVVFERRSPQLYQALLLSGVEYLGGQNAVRAELQSWGDAPETIHLYTSLGFKVMHQQVAYQRKSS